MSRDGFGVVAQQDLRLVQEELTKEEKKFPLDERIKYASCVGRACCGVRLGKGLLGKPFPGGHSVCGVGPKGRVSNRVQPFTASND